MAQVALGHQPPRTHVGLQRLVVGPHDPDVAAVDDLRGGRHQQRLPAECALVPQTHFLGDDVDAVCRSATERWGVPVVPVDAAGFYGTKNLGNRIAGEAMVKYVVGTREPDPLPGGSARPSITVHDVNLVGEYNIAGEFWHVLPLLDELGLRVLCTLSGDARFREVQTMHRAEVNMMVCSKAMINVARKLQEGYGTPWFEGSFYGITDTSQALREFARIIGDADLSARTEALIARQEARIDAALAPWRERLRGRRGLL